VKEEEWKEIPMCTYRRRTGFKVRLKPSHSKLSENIPFKALNLDVEASSTAEAAAVLRYFFNRKGATVTAASPLSSALTIPVP
jgi:hypothetical protein